MKLRIIWIIPNVFCYIMFALCTAFVAKHAKGLVEIDRLFIWIIILAALLIVSILTTFRIRKWIKEGKL